MKSASCMNEMSCPVYRGICLESLQPTVNDVDVQYPFNSTMTKSSRFSNVFYVSCNTTSSLCEPGIAL